MFNLYNTNFYKTGSIFSTLFILFLHLYFNTSIFNTAKEFLKLFSLIGLPDVIIQFSLVIAIFMCFALISCVFLFFDIIFWDKKSQKKNKETNITLFKIISFIMFCIYILLLFLFFIIIPLYFFIFCFVIFIAFFIQRIKK